LKYAKLDERLRDEILTQLSQEQRDFIDNHMRRGKRTQWLNTMAEIKGVSISPDDTFEEICKKVGGWVLTSYEDRGTRDMKCECGRSIRHVYYVTNMELQEDLILGSTCIQLYTKLDANTIALLKRGMERIDLERDEILRKIESGWRLPFHVPDNIEIPLDIQDHLVLNVPLLDRQVARLQMFINNYLHEKAHKDSRFKKDLDPDYPGDLFSFTEAAATSSTSKEPEPIVTPSPRSYQPIGTKIPSAWVIAIEDHLTQYRRQSKAMVTALEVAEHIARMFGLEGNRYPTGKPRSYFLVARFMDELAATGHLELINASVDNRHYSLR